MDSRKTIEGFLVTEFLKGKPFDLRDDESFLQSGVMDSFGLMALVGFLEATFHIKVLDHELMPENLDSMGSLLAYLDKKGVK